MVCKILLYIPEYKFIKGLPSNWIYGLYIKGNINNTKCILVDTINNIIFSGSSSIIGTIKYVLKNVSWIGPSKQISVIKQVSRGHF